MKKSLEMEMCEINFEGDNSSDFFCEICDEDIFETD